MHSKQFFLILCVYIGLSMVFASLLLLRFLNPRNQASVLHSVDIQQNQKYVSGSVSESTVDVPIKITFVRQEKTVGIIEGIYDYALQEWSISNEYAHFAINTSLPSNNFGSTVIYGHNNNRIFGILYSLELEDMVTVTTSKGEIIRYKVFAEESVKPNDVRVLEQSTTPTLVLITCEGAWNQSRRIIYLRKEIST